MNHTIFPLAARVGAALILLAAVVGSTPAADEAKSANPPVNAAAAKQVPSAEQINQVVRQLGDKDYYVRQRAQEELARLGFEAFDALNTAATDDDLEIASRAKYLLRLMRVQWAVESDPPEVKRCLRDYEMQNPRSREARMRDLAALPNHQGLAALCRLVRFEKSPVLSKTAAVALLSAQTSADPPSAATIETVRKGLGGCIRPGAVWLLTWTRLGSEPEAALAEWTKLIDNEQKAPPAETSPEIIAGLTRFQVARLKKLGKADEAMAAIGRLVELEQGKPESLADLLDWLVEQKAWKAVDRLGQRFAPRFAIEPGLLYPLAQAYAEQGRKDQAEETATRAFRLYPGKQQRPLLHHFMAAQHLRQQGQFAWARREFDHVIQKAVDPENNEVRSMAQSVLAEMLHDQGQDLDAAEVLQPLVAALDAGKLAEAELGSRTPAEVRARMNFFFACHWETKGDAAQRREYLDKAIKADPTDVDTLIACYRLPQQTPEYHAKTLELIKKAAEASRQEIAEDPESPSAYNQFAWLVGNTEGDFDEALKCSQKSLELKPDEGGLHDTLARVYFAKGDLQNAIQQQTKAAELDPHSGLIQRQLEFFRKQQTEKTKP